MKRFLALLMALVLSVSLLTDAVIAIDNGIYVADEYQSLIDSDFEVEGTNSFGAMLANALSDEMAEQEENNGCNIFSVEIAGPTAAVELQTTTDSTVVVGIYDESGDTLITTAMANANAEDELVSVTFAGSLPQYFYIKAYLINSESMRPLCTVYESPNYTREMQEFFAKTTDDFEQDRVLNLDADKTNNFAIFGEDVIVIPRVEGVNTLISQTNGVYVIGNADEYFKSLRAGDIFAYEYADGELLIASVGSVTVNGDTVTIVEADIEMEDAFDYVKIDTTAGMDQATIDNSNLEEGVIFEGMVNDEASPYSIMPMATEGSGSAKGSAKYSFVDHEISEGIKISGDGSISTTVKLKFYVSIDYQYIEASVDLKAGLSLSVSGKGQGKIKLGTFGISPMAGIYVEFVPSIVLEFSVKAEISGELKGSAGVRVSNTDGVKNISKTPTFTAKVMYEGEIYVGFSLEPKFKVIHEKIAEISMIARVGAGISGKMTISNVSKGDIVHQCMQCLDGEISGSIEVSLSAKLFDSGKLTLSGSFNRTLKVLDFYYSLDYVELGEGECPHKEYKVDIYVYDNKYQPLSGASVTLSNGVTYTSGSDGKIPSVYFENGTYFANAKLEGYENTSRNFTVNNSPLKYTSILMKKKKEEDKENPGGNSGENPGGNKPQPPAEGERMQVSLGYGHSAVITADGSLYMWGYNYYGQLGNGTTTSSYVPIKIMDNVASVSLGEYHSAAITTDGSLYVWGDNYYGQLGNGTTIDSVVPIKVMDSVASVSLGYDYSAAITTDGTLYLWGVNYYGQLGNGTKQHSYVPKKIMENVVSVSLGYSHSAVITTDGSLYMWGNNGYGQLGNGTTNSSAVPIKAMDNVVSISLGNYHSAAITSNGSLYMWGENGVGQLGNGDGGRVGVWDTKYSEVPVKIMEHVAYVSLGGSHSAAITTDGNLYMWGDNSYGQLGNGDDMPTLAIDKYDDIPAKILSNVAYVNLGLSHSAAITLEGASYIWGANYAGQLGNSSTENSYVPIKIEIPAETTYSTTFAMPMALSAGETDNSFTGLIPNEIYNVYAMRSRTVAEPFSHENLLYIEQCMTDASGTLVYNYQPLADCPNPVIFCKAMLEFDVDNAQITDADVGEDSITIKWEPFVGADMYRVYRVVNGIFIEDGTTSDTSYTVGGLASDREYGFMVACRVNGEWSYQSADDVVYIMTDSPAFISGDLNGDGLVNITDAIELLKYVAKLENNVVNEAETDIDGNGTVNINDAIYLLKKIAGLI